MNNVVSAVTGYAGVFFQFWLVRGMYPLALTVTGKTARYPDIPGMRGGTAASSYA